MDAETLTLPPIDRQSADRPKLRAGTKRANLLRTFLERGELGLNRFDAERLAHDHVLPSSVASLVRDFGFAFPRREESVPGFNGSKVECVRYWLSDDDAILASELLTQWTP